MINTPMINTISNIIYTRIDVGMVEHGDVVYWPDSTNKTIQMSMALVCEYVDDKDAFIIFREKLDFPQPIDYINTCVDKL